MPRPSALRRRRPGWWAWRPWVGSGGGGVGTQRQRAADQAGAARQAQPFVPCVQPLAAVRRDQQDLQIRVDAQCGVDAAINVEIQVGEEVDLVDQHDVRSVEHVWVFQRLVLALGHRENGHLVRLAEIEGRWTDQVAHILDEQHASLLRVELGDGVADHVGVQVAALAGVDLHAAHAGGADAVGVERGFLVAFDYRQIKFAAQGGEGTGKQGGLARSGAGDEVQRQDAALPEKQPVVVSIAVVLAQDVLFDLHHARLAQPRRMRTRRAVAVVVVGTARHRFHRMGEVVRMIVFVRMVMAMVVRVMMRGIGAGQRVAIDAGLVLGTTANGTHISRPPVP
ncbi:hypothetical protein THICB2_400015 [Thiomonas sp. CB2]|nr:hypothetical protein THICB2_400015 [Thiomonas sp. CB2]CQR43063.1 hypothetical protein THICB3320106 [Thiomonas sp. CB3]VDY04879.1 protein of unknown function [Thiomonas sp. Bio17B3]VDY07950.1 protein of unknown function [Thiomonas sp. Sup16B3]VDY13131.1 conserved protein of unknown function [Thiomonas sp. OC7]